MEQPSRDTMIKGAPREKLAPIAVTEANTEGKKLYHFASDGVHRNCAVMASSIEEAQELWLKERKLINELP